MPRARFDDLRPRSRRSFTLDGHVDTLQAHRLDQVEGVLVGIEEAAHEGHWVAGYVAYEAAPSFDPAFVTRPPSGRLPLAWFAVFERRTPTVTPPGTYSVGPWTPDTEEADHAAAVDRIRSAIRAGETYQVNHTFRLSADFDGDPEALYVDLIQRQSCGYGAFIETDDWAIASASPELFFEWRHGRLTSRPMKGTAPRGRDLDDDEARRAGLIESEKERAENLMITDMVRNDMGRIARMGSVSVPELFTTEKYDTVWQLTSTVTSEPRAGTTLVDVFGALFPCASITGAPKVATMGLIAQLETTPRGVYCGAIGYGGPHPSGPEWAFNVGIRTVTVAGAVAHYGTGGGVTYDSTAGGEFREAMLKARVLEQATSRFSLLETMRWATGDGFRHLTAHLERLTRSAWYFDIPLDPAEVRSALDASVRDREEAMRVRLLVDRSGGIRVEAEPAPPQMVTVRLAVDEPLLDPNAPMLRHKTTDRRVYEEAAERHPDADDVVLVTVDGLCADTTIATLCVRMGDTWYTPPIADGSLPGVARAKLLAAGRIRERSIPVEALWEASAIARVNSLRGWEEAVLAAPDLPHPTTVRSRRS